MVENPKKNWHKWHTEIVAWAEGQPIQSRYRALTEFGEWKDDDLPQWFTHDRYEYRIKPTLDCLMPKWDDFFDEERADVIGSNGNVGYEGFLDEL